MKPTFRRKGAAGTRFTLVEGLVTLGTILLLLVILLPILRRGRERADELACINNLRNLSLAIQLYRNEYQVFPRGDLETALVGFTDARGESFCCPTSGESYDNSYAARDALDDDHYVVGCPRHRIVNASPGRGTRIYEFGLVRHDGAPVAVGSEVTAGQLVFADGSRATIQGRVRILTSFRSADGRWYTVLRAFNDSGEVEIDAEVTPGSRFEVVTPAAIAGVAGTRFRVKVKLLATGGSETEVAVTDGRVKVTGRRGSPDWETVELAAGESRKKTAQKSLCRLDPPGHSSSLPQVR